MTNNLIDGDMRQLGKMQKFTLQIDDVIPPDIKELLIAYLKSKTNEEILQADEYEQQLQIRVLQDTIDDLRIEYNIDKEVISSFLQKNIKKISREEHRGK